MYFILSTNTNGNNYQNCPYISDIDRKIGIYIFARESGLQPKGMIPYNIKFSSKYKAIELGYKL